MKTRILVSMLVVLAVAATSWADIWNNSVDFNGAQGEHGWNYGYKQIIPNPMAPEDGITSQFYAFDMCDKGGYLPNYWYWFLTAPWALGGNTHQNRQAAWWDPGWNSVWGPMETTSWPENANGVSKTVWRWTAPAAGNYGVSAEFTGNGPSGTTTDVYVVQNAMIKFQGNINGYADAMHGGAGAFGVHTLSYGDTLALMAGDTLDFIVGNGGNGHGADLTGVHVNIVPEPITLGLLGLGGLVLARRRRG